MVPMHADELEVSEAQVRRLVAEQFPQWSDRRVRALVTTATDNAVFRVGEDLAARFRLRVADVADVRGSLVDEARAQQEFREVSPFAAPERVAIGEPGQGYPLPWSIQTWLPGDDAVEVSPEGSLAFTEDIARLLESLRVAPTHGRHFQGSRRGGHLPDHDGWVQECFTQSEHLMDVDRLRAMWAGFRSLPEVDADVMCHGDLTPANLLVADGRLAGVLDAGGFGPADPALDLVVVWHVLGAEQRAVVQDRLLCSDVQWQRGRAWAFEQAVGLVWYYAHSNPKMSQWGRRTIDRLIQTHDD